MATISLRVYLSMLRKSPYAGKESQVGVHGGVLFMVTTRPGRSAAIRLQLRLMCLECFTDITAEKKVEIDGVSVPIYPHVVRRFGLASLRLAERENAFRSMSEPLLPALPIPDAGTDDAAAMTPLPKQLSRLYQLNVVFDALGLFGATCSALM